jgi:hypothetical protein
MSVSAYITAGATVIPTLLPTQEMRNTARQIGIPEEDLFRVDVPVGMTQHTRASVLVASTQIANLYASTTVSLTLEDSSGLSVVLSGLYARPQQPFFWRQSGGVVMVELVDERWYWKFSSAAILNTNLSPTWSSDGRWRVDSTRTYADLITDIGTVATGDNLTMPTDFTTQSPEYIRRLGDLCGSPNVSLALLLDAIASANQQIVVSTGSSTRFISRIGLKAQYNGAMNTYQTAMRGGMQPVNGAALSTDALVSLWNATGYQARAPQIASVVMPRRSVEGRTVFNNVTIANTPAADINFSQQAVDTQGATPTWVRAPNDIGSAYLTDASIVVNDATGAELTSSPGWNPANSRTKIRDDYVSRNSNIPFGRTVWAGWIPWYTSASVNIGQLGNVSYRMAEIDGELAPYTISEASEEDWRFGLQGTSEVNPSDLVTAKGNAQAYRNLVGATIIDVPPPMCRVFPAKITGSELYSNWRWLYTFEEVEPNPAASAGGTPSVAIGAYGRTGTINARNMAENGNFNFGFGNVSNVIAPGVYQSDYTNAKISANPICNDTIVMMVEQFPTSYTGGSPPFGPQYWFSMPNAVVVTCNTPS